MIGPPVPCVEPGCERPHYARGMCATHYRRWYRGPTAPTDNRTHGIRATYCNGCRCRPCQAADATYKRDLRRRKAAAEGRTVRRVSVDWVVELRRAEGL